MTAPGDTKPTPRLAWAPVAREERRITARYLGGTGITVLSWGDGKVEELGMNATLNHLYDKPGAYMLVLRELGPNGKVLATEQIYIRPGLYPQVEWAANPENPNLWQCKFLDDGTKLISRFYIDWKDGSATPSEEVWGLPGTTVQRFFQPGDHQILIKDLGSNRLANDTHTIIGKVYDPDATFAEDKDDTTRFTVKVTLTKVAAGKAVLIDWGDSEQTTVPDPAVGTETSHQYPAIKGDYIVQVQYSDGSGEPRAELVSVPYTDPQSPQVVEES